MILFVSTLVASLIYIPQKDSLTMPCGLIPWSTLYYQLGWLWTLNYFSHHAILLLTCSSACLLFIAQIQCQRYGWLLFIIPRLRGLVVLLRIPRLRGFIMLCWWCCRYLGSSPILACNNNCCHQCLVSCHCFTAANVTVGLPLFTAHLTLNSYSLLYASTVASLLS